MARDVSGDFEQRIIELETRLAFQEHALAELGDALAQSRMEATRHAEQLRRALDDMRQGRGELFADPATEPPPPHY